MLDHLRPGHAGATRPAPDFAQRDPASPQALCPRTQADQGRPQRLPRHPRHTDAGVEGRVPDRRGYPYRQCREPHRAPGLSQGPSGRGHRRAQDSIVCMSIVTAFGIATMSYLSLAMPSPAHRSSRIRHRDHPVSVKGLIGHHRTKNCRRGRRSFWRTMWSRSCNCC